MGDFVHSPSKRQTSIKTKRKREKNPEREDLREHVIKKMTQVLVKKKNTFRYLQERSHQSEKKTLTGTWFVTWVARAAVRLASHCNPAATARAQSGASPTYNLSSSST
ncbi:UNVERIFIED_CONTAM: hypothetical protein K2H54_019329 [Gekko kuhli]